MIKIKVLRCLDCGYVLAEKYTPAKSKKTWFCTDCILNTKKTKRIKHGFYELSEVK